MNNKIKIIHTPIDSEGSAEHYYIIITEIVNTEIVRSYMVKLPLWVSINMNMDYRYYKYIFN